MIDAVWWQWPVSGKVAFSWIGRQDASWLNSAKPVQLSVSNVENHCISTSLVARLWTWRTMFILPSLTASVWVVWNVSPTRRKDPRTGEVINEWSGAKIQAFPSTEPSSRWGSVAVKRMVLNSRPNPSTFPSKWILISDASTSTSEIVPEPVPWVCSDVIFLF